MTELKPINGKAIYTTKGAAREYGRIGCNFYVGCPHNCHYCYLKRGHASKYLGKTEVTLKKCFKDEDHAFDVFCQEVQDNADLLRKTGVFFSFTTDPMIAETRRLTLNAVALLCNHGIKSSILTKDAYFIGNLDARNKLKCLDKSLVQFGFTLTARDDMEPNASTNHERIVTMRWLHYMGFKTFASIEPVIDWIHAGMAVTFSLDCCDHYKIGLRSGVGKNYYDLIQSGMYIRYLTEQIVKDGRTVYLKKSTRALMRRCFIEKECERILAMTLDMDGQPYKKECFFTNSSPTSYHKTKERHYDRKGSDA